MTAFICEEVAMEQTCCTKLGEGRVADYCKHASTAMVSIVDVHAEDKLKAKEAKRKAAEASSAAKRVNIEEADSTKIEATLPGETKRIEEGLASFGGDKVLKHLQGEAKILKGLKLITALFPKSILPLKKLEHCLRCGKDWDARYPNEAICLMEHPPHQYTTEMWDTSKFSWTHCDRCGRDFDPQPHLNISRRLRGTFYRDARHCYRGKHTSHKTVVADEGWGSESS